MYPKQFLTAPVARVNWWVLNFESETIASASATAPATRNRLYTLPDGDGISAVGSSKKTASTPHSSRTGASPVRRRRAA